MQISTDADFMGFYEILIRNLYYFNTTIILNFLHEHCFLLFTTKTYYLHIILIDIILIDGTQNLNLAKISLTSIFLV